MKFAICKQDCTGDDNLNEGLSFGVERGWVYKVVEDNGVDVVVVTESIVGAGHFKFNALRKDLCEITEEEYKFFEEVDDEPELINKKLDELIERNWELKP